MDYLNFRVGSLKYGNLVETRIKRGRMSDARVRDALLATYLRYAESDLSEIVERFANNRGRSSHRLPALASNRFFDPAKNEQGIYIGTPDCFVIAAETLSAEQTAFLQEQIAKNRGAV